MIAAIDLEGVLAPEIWPHLGDEFAIAELHLTTRDTADFDDLMQQRVTALNRAGVTLKQVQAVAHKVPPYLGSREFLKRIVGVGVRMTPVEVSIDEVSEADRKVVPRVERPLSLGRYVPKKSHAIVAATWHEG